MIKNKIIESLEKATGEKNIHLETPQMVKHGDWSSNIAMQIASRDNTNPRDTALEIIDNITKDKLLDKYISKITVAGPGFINFWISNDLLLNNLENVLKEGDLYGATKKSNKGKAIVEYSSPNIAKPFTVGHLRSTVIGDAIANLLEFTGWEVLRDNHIGDWGTQFGKQIYAIKTWGDEKQIENSENPVKELVSLYVKFHEEAEKDPSIEDKGREWFKKLEDGDEEARTLWRKCIEWSWQEFNKIYEKLGVKFSEEFNGGRGLGESFFEDKMDEVINALEEKGMLKEGEKGAKLVFFEDDKYPPAMILKKDGTTLYHTRDLATDLYRKKMYDPDLIINEVGVEQTLYFQQLYEMEKMLGWYEEGQRVHISHSLFRFKDEKMSTRKGNVVWLEEIIEEAIDKARELGSDDNILADQVAIGAIKWNDLKRDPKTEIIFDWDEILNMEGNSGPYMQYTYARAVSVLEKAGVKKDLLENNGGTKIEDNSEFNEDELEIMRFLIRFGEVIEESAKQYKPNLLANYLYDLAQKYNSFYNKHQIIDSENEKLRLVISASVSIVLKNGLGVLGIAAPGRM